MNPGFPLLSLPRRAIFLSSEPKFLNAVRSATPTQLSRKFTSEPRIALQALSGERDYWQGVENLLACAAMSRIDGRGEAHHYVNQYFTDWRRLRLSCVLVVDHLIPKVDGIELVRHVNTGPMRRILLANTGDTHAAVDALNAGLVQRFIDKDRHSLLENIQCSCEELHRDLCTEIGQLVRPTLTSEQMSLLQNPEVSAGLKRKISELGWEEYVVVGYPFGLLGMSFNGPLQWLQLETTSSMHELAEVAAASASYSSQDLEAIRCGAAMITNEILMQLQISMEPGLIVAHPISNTSSRVYCALLDLPSSAISLSNYGRDEIHTV